MHNIFHILVILPNNLGDTIMATVILEGLKKKYPESQITFFVEDGFEGGISNNPFLDNLFLFKRKKIRDMYIKENWQNASLEFINALTQLNKYEYDLLINLSQHKYISHIIPLINAKSLYGRCFLREGNEAVMDHWTQYLYAIPFARRYNSFHAVDVYRRITNVSEHHGSYTIELTDKEKRDAKEYLAGKGVDTDSRKTITFQPGAAFPSKCWPAHHFINLGRLLIQRGWQIVISGAPSEKELAISIKQNIGKNCFITAGNTTFRQAIANLSFSQACVTGDTALMHAAAALDVKIFALFGVTNPVETGPYGDGHYIFSGGCAQKPCFCRECKSMLCMEQIIPETLLQCIENDIPPKHPGCDIYKTSLYKNSDYSLERITPETFSYFDKAGAVLTKNAFGEKFFLENFLKEDMEKCFEESRKFISILTQMEYLLSDYLHNKNSKAISAFEKQKETLPQLSGIACFWIAVLNLRLNSIPLINPVEAISLSAKACSETKKQIQGILPTGK